MELKILGFPSRSSVWLFTAFCPELIAGEPKLKRKLPLSSSTNNGFEFKFPLVTFTKF